MTIDKDNTLVLVFQQKEEHSNWATYPQLRGRVLPLRSGDSKISVFKPADGEPRRHHVHTFFDDFSRSYNRLYAQRLGEDIEEKRSRRLPKGFYLPWSLFVEELEKFRPGPGSVESRYRESMIYSCKDWINCFGDIFDYYQSDMLDKLYNWSGLCTITVDAPIAASTAYITFIVRHFQNKSRLIFESGGIPKAIFYIIEDSSILTDESELSGMTSPLVHMSFISRIYNQGFIFVGHNISTSFSKKLLGNLESMVIFGISEPTRVIQDLLRCSEQQAKVGQAIRPGELLTVMPAFHARTVYARYPYIAPPRKLTESERQDIVGQFLGTVKAIKYIERGLPAAAVGSRARSAGGAGLPEVNSDELKFLVLAGTGKRLTMTQIYGQLGFSRRRGKQILDSLERKAAIRSKCFGRTSFPEVLEPGKIIIESKGFKCRDPKSGGFDHQLGLDLVEESEKGNVVRREIDLFGKRLDLESRNRITGELKYYQVGVSDPAREAANLIEIAQINVVKNNKLIFVARDAKFAASVREILKSKDQSGYTLSKVDIKTISDYVDTQESP